MSTGPDTFLLDLFREEVRSNVETLANGLVELEQQPTNIPLIEPLMRAAHSIKGASRVIGVDAGVQVAHVMEELLVAAQKGAVTIGSGHVDLLLRGADLLTQIRDAVGEHLPDWVAVHASIIADLTQRLIAAAAGAPVEKPTSTSTPSTVEATAPETSTSSTPTTATSSGNEPAFTKEAVDYHAISQSPLYPIWRDEVVKQCSAAMLAFERWAALDDAILLSDALTRVGQGIRSASFLIGVRPIARMGSAIEKRSAAIREDAAHLTVTVSADVRRIAELLGLIAGIDSFELERFVEDNGAELGAIAARLEDLPTRVDGEFERTTNAPPAVMQSVAAMQSRSVAVLDPAPFQASPQKPVATQPALTEVVFTTSSPVESTQTSPSFAEPSHPSTVKTPASSSLIAGTTQQSSTQALQAETDERVVRVTAQSLTRLMGLAGESLVEAHWLPGFANALLKLKKHQQMASDLLDDAIQALKEGASSQSVYEGLNAVRQKLLDCRTELGTRIGDFEQHTRQSDDLNSRLYHEVIASRMRPLADGVQGFPRMVRDLARQLGKRVQLDIEGQSAPVDRDILEKLDAPFGHILRNAVDHGLELPAERLKAGKPEVGSIKLSARHYAGMLLITISDDGRGIDIEKLRRRVVERGLTNAETASRLAEAELLEFLFLPGFSTRDQVTQISGRGVGLDVVHSTIYGVGGSVRLTTQLGVGSTFHLRLPTTLSVIRAVLCKVAGEPYAFPHNRIDRILRVKTESVSSLEHRQFCQIDGRNVGLVFARQLFQLDDPGSKKPAANEPQAPTSSLRNTAPDELCVVLFSHHDSEYGLIVDEFRGEQDLVVRSLEARLGKVPNIQAAAILDDGSPSLIVDLDDLRISIERLLKTQKLQRSDGRSGSGSATGKRRVLVVDDSITVREVQRQLLTQKGYEVEVAVDGADGWNRIRDDSFDLVISDIDMPRMNGFDFVRAIKTDNNLQSTPVIIVSYKDREEDRLRGLEVGANYYLTKSSFHDETLLDAVQELIGESNG